MLFLLDAQPIGVARLDKRGVDGGVVRLVAIIGDLQRAGHGRVMSAMIDDVARSRGITQLFVNAIDAATDFCLKTGWSLFDWDPAELTGIASRCVQMRKAV